MISLLRSRSARLELLHRSRSSFVASSLDLAKVGSLRRRCRQGYLDESKIEVTFSLVRLRAFIKFVWMCLVLVWCFVISWCQSCWFDGDHVVDDGNGELNESRNMYYNDNKTVTPTITTITTTIIIFLLITIIVITIVIIFTSCSQRFVRSLSCCLFVETTQKQRTRKQDFSIGKTYSSKATRPSEGSLVYVQVGQTL